MRTLGSVMDSPHGGGGESRFAQPAASLVASSQSFSGLLGPASAVVWLHVFLLVAELTGVHRCGRQGPGMWTARLVSVSALNTPNCSSQPLPLLLRTWHAAGENSIADARGCSGHMCPGASEMRGKNGFCCFSAPKGVRCPPFWAGLGGPVPRSPLPRHCQACMWHLLRIAALGACDWRERAFCFLGPRLTDAPAHAPERHEADGRHL